MPFIFGLQEAQRGAESDEKELQDTSDWTLSSTTGKKVQKEAYII